HSGKNGGYIGTEKVGPHTCNISDVVTDVIGNGRGVAYIIFRYSCFNLSHEISAYVSSFCIYPSADTGEQGYRLRTQRESRKYFNGFLHVDACCGRSLGNKDVVKHN